jgi:agmatine deiminase
MNKKFIVISIIIIYLIVSSIFGNAQQTTKKAIDELYEQDKIWFENNPYSLPIWLTSEEINHLDKIGNDLKSTDAPPSPVRMPAEFEPMQGVLIRYPFGISYQIIAEMSEDVEVITIVADASEQSFVYSQYLSYGVNVENCYFLIAPSDSYWTRDYGPWFIFNGNDEQGIVDFIYNRPRPNDDLIPIKYGNWQQIPVYGMNLVHAGGNYMTDGQGIAISTDLVWDENSGYSPEEINQTMQEYCGIDTYQVVPDALGAYIKHIDCWAKYLLPDTIMIIKSSPAHSHYNDFEEAVEYFENQTNCYGTKYNIVRVYTDMSEPYINSLILNNKVFVPITGSQGDDEAIESYQDAMPGYEVLGFTGSWSSTDALHCRAIGIVDRYMLYIEHTPLSGTQSSHDGYDIYAKIFSYSGENLISDKTGVYWKTDGGSWHFIQMESLGNDEYHAIIPQQEKDTIINYYIHAEDSYGRIENHPYIGGSMAHIFTAHFKNNPPETPMIAGPTEGKIGVEYNYSINNTVDPEGDKIYIYCDWGNGTSDGWLGPYNSSEEIYLSHIWSKKGSYTIKAKIKDEFDSESNWGTLTVTIPKSKMLYYNLFFDFLKDVSIYIYK